MAFPWEFYSAIAGVFVGCAGFGIAFGQFRLGIKEIVDSTGA
ncbi:hypothetical protein [Pseudomonas mangiferae]|nr:hypothetical protein [Pseudomonas mangiferae]